MQILQINEKWQHFSSIWIFKGEVQSLYKY